MQKKNMLDWILSELRWGVQVTTFGVDVHILTQIEDHTKKKHNVHDSPHIYCNWYYFSKYKRSNFVQPVDQPKTKLGTFDVSWAKLFQNQVQIMHAKKADCWSQDMIDIFGHERTNKQMMQQFKEIFLKF